MDKYECRRLRLKELINDRCSAVAAQLARDIERDPTYVNRMLYPEGKKGKKRIGDDLLEVLEKTYSLPRGWFDLPPGSEVESQASKITIANEPQADYRIHPIEVREVIDIMTNEEITEDGRRQILAGVRAIVASWGSNSGTPKHRRVG